MEKRKKKFPASLTIAGSDSGGGAGIQADLKTFSALGAYGASVITALTAQNTTGVKNILGVDSSFIKDQLDAVLDDIEVDAVKIGMLHDPGIIEVITDRLDFYQVSPIVLDPVMVAKSGDKLLNDNSIDTLKQVLIPKVTIITPNIPEAEVLVGNSISDENDMIANIKELGALGPSAVLLKGGHLQSPQSPDYLYIVENDDLTRLDSARINTENTHGTGCTFSSAIAAYMARGLEVKEAVKKAKSYMSGALKAGANKKIGKGKGPVHHFFNWWE